MTKRAPVGTIQFDPILRNPVQDNGEYVPELRLVPISNHPEKQAYIDRLIAMGWRYHHRTAEWVDLTDPTREVIPCGRLCTLPDFSDAWLRPPGPAPAPGQMAVLPPSLRVFDKED